MYCVVPFSIQFLLFIKKKKKQNKTKNNLHEPPRIKFLCNEIFVSSLLYQPCDSSPSKEESSFEDCPFPSDKYRKTELFTRLHIATKPPRPN